MTKEQLIKNFASMEGHCARLKLEDERIRKEFAKSFGWYKPSKLYDYGNERDSICPTWEQIFVEIGKLLDTRFYEHIRQDLDSIKRTVGELELKNKEASNPS